MKSNLSRTEQRRSAKIIIALCSALCVLLAASEFFGQAGRRATPDNERTAVLNLTIARPDGATEPIETKQIALYDDGVEQRIENFAYDPTPARIVLLVDNSQTLRADLDKLTETAREFAYEIYEGDQLFTIAYDQTPEIVHEWTDDAKKVEAALKNFRKKGEPFLLDALGATIDQVFRPLTGASRKQAIVIIGDGLDRGSKAKFDYILAELQRLDITVYALQSPDRTGGALRRDMPKPAAVVKRLTEGTGGKAFPLTDANAAAKAICDELRKNRYTIAYTPTNPASLDPRRLLVTGGEKMQVRHKTQQPPR